MSENTNRVNPAEPDSMSTEELEAFLQRDMLLPDDKQSDAETIRSIMEALEKRTDAPQGATKSTQEAFDEFQRLYLPAVGLELEPEKTVRFPQWLRRALATAAVVAVLLAGGFSVGAIGDDIWETIAVWTDEIFRFQNHNEGVAPATEAELEEVRRMMAAWESGEASLLGWLPEGFALDTVDTSETPRTLELVVQYARGEERILLLCRYHRYTMKPFRTSKGEQPPELLEIGGQTHYLLCDEGYISALWITGRWECGVYGPVTMEEMEQILASIYEGE